MSLVCWTPNDCSHGRVDIEVDDDSDGKRTKNSANCFQQTCASDPGTASIKAGFQETLLAEVHVLEPVADRSNYF